MTRPILEYNTVAEFSASSLYGIHSIYSNPRSIWASRGRSIVGPAVWRIEGGPCCRAPSIYSCHVSHRCLAGYAKYLQTPAEYLHFSSKSCRYLAGYAGCVKYLQTPAEYQHCRYLARCRYLACPLHRIQYLSGGFGWVQPSVSVEPTPYRPTHDQSEQAAAGELLDQPYGGSPSRRSSYHLSPTPTMWDSSLNEATWRWCEPTCQCHKSYIW